MKKTRRYLEKIPTLLAIILLMVQTSTPLVTIFADTTTETNQTSEIENSEYSINVTEESTNLEIVETSETQTVETGITTESTNPENLVEQIEPSSNFEKNDQPTESSTDIENKNEKKENSTRINKAPPIEEENKENRDKNKQPNNEKIDIKVTKRWQDENDLNGFRPEEVKISLYVEGESQAVKTAILTAKTFWTMTFKNMPKYDKGKSLKYTVKEAKVENYQSKVERQNNNFVITNIHEVKRMQVSGKKIWRDDNNQDGLRPDKIKVYLLADGKKIASQEVSSKDNWSYNFDNLPEYQAGRKIHYMITEDEVVGYSKKVDGYDLTNTHVREKIDLTVTKKWIDNHNKHGIRPKQITVSLYDADLKKTIETVTLTEKMSWTTIFKNLPKYRDGKLINYTIKEGKVDGYQSKLEKKDNHIVLTNTYEPEEIDLKVTKKWLDENDLEGFRPKEIKVSLYKEGQSKSVETATLTEKTDWQTTFKDLPKYDDGKLIKYTIKEANVPGYYSKVERTEQGFELINKHKVERIQINGKKTWHDGNDQDGIRPDKIKVNLLANDKKVDTNEVSRRDDWSYTFRNLPEYQAGRKINYTISEDKVKGYEDKVEGYNLTNTHKPEEIELKVTKKWLDENDLEGFRPKEIKVSLYKEGNHKALQTMTLTAKTDWQTTFKDLPKYDDGNLIKYTIKENKVDGYQVKVERTDKGFELTNTHKVSRIQINGKKTWHDGNDQDGLRPDKIKVNLLANGEKVDTKEVSRRDDWSYTFRNLPEYQTGDKINYTISEDKVKGYEDKVDGYNLTNTHKPEEIELKITKKWLDENDLEGFRPKEIKVSLYKEGNHKALQTMTLTAKTDWQTTFKDLPKYDDGKLIKYTIKEANVPGYYSKVERTDKGFELINTHKVSRIQINGKKTWRDGNDQDGIRPDKIKVNLWANGEKVDTKEVSRRDDWSYTFRNLPEYQAGRKVNYTISEDEVKGYSDKVDGYNLTNTHKPEKIELKVTKKWLDENDLEGFRPKEIQVSLYKEGNKKALQTMTLTAKTDWQTTFKDLPKYDDGKLIKYTIKEANVPGYYSKVERTDKGFELINTHKVSRIQINGKKTWHDGNDQDGLRPDKIKVNLLANGKKVDTKEVSRRDDWSYTFRNLPEYQAGRKINYTISEDKVKGYEDKVDGYNLTNTHKPEEIELKVTKKWLDENDLEGFRPKEIQVSLYKEGQSKSVETATLTAKTNWQTTFKDLPKYDDGKLIKYTMKEAKVDGYYSKVERTDKGFELINTHKVSRIQINGKKTWRDGNDQDGIRPDKIKVNLLANGEKVDTKEVSRRDDWSYTFRNLPEYQAGRKINYTISEDKVKGYEDKVDGYNLTNTHKPEKIELKVTKKWLDENDLEGFRPKEIQVSLYKEGNKKSLQTMTLTAKTDWQTTFKDLPKYDDGKLIKYTIKESKVDGYYSKVERTDKGFELINTHKVSRIQINGKKTWRDGNDQDGLRPDKIKVNLLANGKKVDTKEVSRRDDWSYTFRNLPEYQAGRKINYTISEDKVKGYEDKVDGYNLTNTHKPEEIELKVTKKWLDENDVEGFRPKEIKVSLYEEGQSKSVETATLTAKTNWQTTFKNLPKYDDGKLIKYTMKEAKVDGYYSKVERTDKGFELINMHKVERIQINGKKIWRDNENQDNVRPDKITVDLFANGKKLMSKEVSSKTNWGYDFGKLPKYLNGTKVEYDVVENQVDHYVRNEDAETGFNLVNDYVPNEVSVTISKIWNDNNDENGNRPDSIKVHLLADNQKIAEQVITAEQNWYYEFTGLKELSEGKIISYSIEEEPVEGYQTVITGNVAEGFVITNSIVIIKRMTINEEEPPIEPKGTQKIDNSPKELKIAQMVSVKKEPPMKQIISAKLPMRTQQKLPKTGENKSEGLAALGLVITAFTGLSYGFYRRKES